MKKLQKLAGALLALVMVMGLSVTAFADGTTYTITISNSTEGYVYTAYQIFKGDLSSDATTLSNVAWGDDITNEDNALGAVKTITIGEDPDITSPFSACTSASDVAGVLSGNVDDSEIVKKFAEVISSYVNGGTASEYKNSDSNYTISDLPAGYYLVINTDVPDGNNTAYTSYILEVVGDVEVSPKADTPTLDKEVDSTTDSSDTDPDETSADYSVGDDVSYKLIATLPSNYGDYDTYKLIFHDTMVSGLSFNGDVSVAVYTAHTNLDSWVSGITYYTYNGKELVKVVDTSSNPVSTTTYYTADDVDSSGYAVKTSSTGNLSHSTCTFEVEITDTNSLSDGTNDITVTSSSLIVVSFTAKLTEEASTGKTNTASLEYSNNPNSGGEGDTGTTPEDVTTVFTFTLDVDKIDASSNPLEGAGFALYKEVEITSAEYADGTYYYIDTDSKKMTAAGDYDTGTTYYTQVEVLEGGYQEATNLTEFKSGVKYYTKDGTNYTAVDTAAVTTPASGTTYYVKNNYTFDGLGIGNYVLVESTTPSGYNTMEDLYITISATTTESSQTGSVKTLTVTVKDANGNTVTSPFTEDKSTGEIKGGIENRTGSELPTTGGIGTTIFYIVGSVLLLGAVVLLITRRRMRKA